MNVYAMAHLRMQDQTENYLLIGPLLTLYDLQRYDKFLPYNRNLAPFKMTVIAYSHMKVERFGDDVCHTLMDDDILCISIILKNFLYLCPICLEYNNVNYSFIYDCGHIMCWGCVVGKINAFPDVDEKTLLFKRCHFCR